MNQQHHIPGLSRAVEEIKYLAESFSKNETLGKGAALHISEGELT